MHRFYRVAADATGFYLFPFALGNFLGPVLLGPLFDIVGRRRMIVATFTLSAIMLALTGGLFAAGALSERVRHGLLDLLGD